MLRKLTVENFFSIAEAQTFDLGVAKNVPDPDRRFANPIKDSPDRFPRVAALLGANASGKTNLLRAIAFLVNFIRDSADSRPGLGLPFLPFYANDWEERTTKFVVEFDAGIFADQESRIVYLYELEISSDGKNILREALKYYPEGRPRRLFDRKGSVIDAGKDFKFSKRDPVRDKIRANASVISVLAKFNHAFALDLYRSIAMVYSNVAPVGARIDPKEDMATKWYFDNPQGLQELATQIRKFDFGITDVVLQNEQGGTRPFFKHRGLDRNLDYLLESQGTVRFYKLFPQIHSVLTYGGIAVIDEFDNDIHPLILPEIMKLFQSPETNPLDGQIILSCHSPTILECLNKEEVFFTEKNIEGATEIYGLKDVQSVRRDANLYAKYLSGAFGAIPKVG